MRFNMLYMRQVFLGAVTATVLMVSQLFAQSIESNLEIDDNYLTEHPEILTANELYITGSAAVTWSATNYSVVTAPIVINNSASLTISGALYTSNRVTSNGTLTISSNGSLIFTDPYNNGNNSGASLYKSPSANLTNNGIVAVPTGGLYWCGNLCSVSLLRTTNNPSFNGSVVPYIRDGETIATSSGTFTPTECENGFIVAPGASVTMNADVALMTDATITISPGATLTVPAGKTLTTIATSTINNNGTLTIATGGTLNYHNESGSASGGVLNNNPGAILNNAGMIQLLNAFSNSGVVNNSGTIDNQSNASSDFQNNSSGIVYNSGTWQDAGHFTNNAGALFINTTTAAVLDREDNESNFTNSGTIALVIGSKYIPWDSSQLTVATGGFATAKTYLGTISNGRVIPYLVNGQTIGGNSGTVSREDCADPNLTSANMGFIIEDGATVTLHSTGGEFPVNIGSFVRIGYGSTFIIDTDATQWTVYGAVQNYGVIINKKVIYRAGGSMSGSGVIVKGDPSATSTSQSNNPFPMISYISSTTNVASTDGDLTPTQVAAGFAIADNNTVTIKEDVTMTGSIVLLGADSELIVEADKTLVVPNGASLQIGNGSVTNNGMIALQDGAFYQNGNDAPVTLGRGKFKALQDGGAPIVPCLVEGNSLSNDPARTFSYDDCSKGFYVASGKVTRINDNGASLEFGVDAVVKVAAGAKFVNQGILSFPSNSTLRNDGTLIVDRVSDGVLGRFDVTGNPDFVNTGSVAFAAGAKYTVGGREVSLAPQGYGLGHAARALNFRDAFNQLTPVVPFIKTAGQVGITRANVQGVTFQAADCAHGFVVDTNAQARIYEDVTVEDGIADISAATSFTISSESVLAIKDGATLVSTGSEYVYGATSSLIAMEPGSIFKVGPHTITVAKDGYGTDNNELNRWNDLFIVPYLVDGTTIGGTGAHDVSAADCQYGFVVAPGATVTMATGVTLQSLDDEISSNGYARVSAGANLIIPSGVTFLIDGTGTLENFGTITNHGTLTSMGNLTNMAGANLTSEGTEDEFGAAILTCWGPTTYPITNNGIVNNNAYSTLHIGNAGTFKNNGTLNNADTVTLDNGAVLNNTGTINTSKTMTIAGELNNSPAGSRVINTGTLTLNANGTITNHGTIDNNKTLNVANGIVYWNNYGTVNNNNQASCHFLANVNSNTNTGAFINKEGASLTLDSTDYDIVLALEVGSTLNGSVITAGSFAADLNNQNPLGVVPCLEDGATIGGSNPTVTAADCAFGFVVQTGAAVTMYDDVIVGKDDSEAQVTIQPGGALTIATGKALCMLQGNFVNNGIIGNRGSADFNGVLALTTDAYFNGVQVAGGNFNDGVNYNAATGMRINVVPYYQNGELISQDDSQQGFVIADGAVVTLGESFALATNAAARVGNNALLKITNGTFTISNRTTVTNNGVIACAVLGDAAKLAAIAGTLINNGALAFADGTEYDGETINFSSFTDYIPTGKGTVVPYLFNGDQIGGQGLTIDPQYCVNGFVVDPGATISIKDNVSVQPGGWVRALSTQLSVDAGYDLAIADGAYLNGNKVGASDIDEFEHDATIPYLVDGAVIGGTGANDVSLADCFNGFTVKAGASVTLANNLIVNDNGEIVIEAGATLTISAGKTLTLNGVTSLLNNGTLVIDGVLSTLSTNVTNASSGIIINNNRCVLGGFTNSGLVINVHSTLPEANCNLGQYTNNGTIALEIGSMFYGVHVISGNIPDGCGVYLRDGSSIGTSRAPTQVLPADCAGGLVIAPGANVTMYEDVLIENVTPRSLDPKTFVQIGAGATLTIADGKALMLSGNVVFNNRGSVFAEYDAQVGGVVAITTDVKVTSGVWDDLVAKGSFIGAEGVNDQAGLGVNIVPYLVDGNTISTAGTVSGADCALGFVVADATAEVPVTVNISGTIELNAGAFARVGTNALIKTDDATLTVDDGATLLNNGVIAFTDTDQNSLFDASGTVINNGALALTNEEATVNSLSFGQNKDFGLIVPYLYDGNTIVATAAEQTNNTYFLASDCAYGFVVDSAANQININEDIDVTAGGWLTIPSPGTLNFATGKVLAIGDGARLNGKEVQAGTLTDYSTSGVVPLLVDGDVVGGPHATVSTEDCQLGFVVQAGASVTVAENIAVAVGNIVEVQAGATLAINKGKELGIDINSTLYNDGTIVVNGTLDNHGTLNNSLTGIITNNGIFNNLLDNTNGNQVPALLINDGVVINNRGAVFSSDTGKIKGSVGLAYGSILNDVIVIAPGSFSLYNDPAQQYFAQPDEGYGHLVPYLENGAVVDGSSDFAFGFIVAPNAAVRVVEDVVVSADGAIAVLPGASLVIATGKALIIKAHADFINHGNLGNKGLPEFAGVLALELHATFNGSTVSAGNFTAADNYSRTEGINTNVVPYLTNDANEIAQNSTIGFHPEDCSNGFVVADGSVVDTVMVTMSDDVNLAANAVARVGTNAVFNVNAKTFTLVAGATLINNGTVQNNGTIANSGDFINEVGSGFSTAAGTITGKIAMAIDSILNDTNTVTLGSLATYNAGGYFNGDGKLVYYSPNETLVNESGFTVPAGAVVKVDKDVVVTSGSVVVEQGGILLIETGKMLAIANGANFVNSGAVGSRGSANFNGLLALELGATFNTATVAKNGFGDYNIAAGMNTNVVPYLGNGKAIPTDVSLADCARGFVVASGAVVTVTATDKDAFTDVLQLDNGAIARVCSGGRLNIVGMLVLGARGNQSPTTGMLQNDGYIYMHAVLNGQTYIFENHGTVINNGTIEIGSDQFINATDSIFSNNAGALFCVQPGAKFLNIGNTKTNDGIIAFAAGSDFESVGDGVGRGSFTDADPYSGQFGTVLPFLRNGDIISTNDEDSFDPADCANGFVIQQYEQGAPVVSGITFKADVMVNPGSQVVVPTNAIITLNGCNLAIAEGAYLNGTQVVADGIKLQDTNHTSQIMVPYLVDGDVVGGVNQTVSVDDCANGFIVQAGARVVIADDVTIAANKRVEVLDGATLTINAGKTLLLTNQNPQQLTTLRNSGTMIIEGTLDSTAIIINQTTGRIINNGTIQNQNNANLDNSNGGVVINTIGANFATGAGTISGDIAMAIGSLLNNDYAVTSGSFATYNRDNNYFRGTGKLIEYTDNGAVVDNSTDFTGGFIVPAGAVVTVTDDVVVTSGDVVVDQGGVLLIATGKMLAITNGASFTNNGVVGSRASGKFNGLLALDLGAIFNGQTVAPNNFANNYSGAPGINTNVVPYLGNGKVIPTHFISADCSNGFVVADGAVATLETDITLAADAVAFVGANAVLKVDEATLTIQTGVTLVNNGVVAFVNEDDQLSRSQLVVAVGATITNNGALAFTQEASYNGQLIKQSSNLYGKQDGLGLFVPYLTDSSTIGSGATATPLWCTYGFVVEPSATTVTVNENVYVVPEGFVIARADQLNVAYGKELAIANGARLNGEAVKAGSIAVYNKGGVIPYLVDGDVVGGVNQTVSVDDCANGFIVEAGARVVIAADVAINASKSVEVQAGATLTINAGKTLTLASGVTVDNSGTMIVEGTLDSTATLTNQATGRIINNGTIQNQGDAILNNNLGGVVINTIGANFATGGGTLTGTVAMAYGSILDDTNLVTSGSFATYNSNNYFQGVGYLIPYLTQGDIIGGPNATGTAADCANGFLIEDGANVLLEDDIYCTSANAVYRVGVNANLTVAQGVTLAINSGSTLANYGVVTNNGVIGLAVGAFIKGNNATTIAIGSFDNATLFSGSGVVVPYLGGGDVILNGNTGQGVTPTDCANGFVVLDCQVLSDTTVNAGGVVNVVSLNHRKHNTLTIGDGDTHNPTLTISSGASLNNNDLLTVSSGSIVASAGALNACLNNMSGTIALAVGSTINGTQVESGKFGDYSVTYFDEARVVPYLVGTKSISVNSGSVTPDDCVNGFVLASGASVSMGSDTSISSYAVVKIPVNATLAVSTGINFGVTSGATINNTHISANSPQPFYGKYTGGDFGFGQTDVTIVPYITGTASIGDDNDYSTLDCANGFVVAKDAVVTIDGGDWNTTGLVEVREGGTLIINPTAKFGLSYLTNNGTVFVQGNIHLGNALTNNVGAYLIFEKNATTGDLHLANHGTVAIAYGNSFGKVYGSFAPTSSNDNAGLTIPYLYVADTINGSEGHPTADDCKYGFMVAPGNSVAMDVDVAIEQDGLVEIGDGATLTVNTGTTLVIGKNSTLINSGTLTNSGRIALANGVSIIDPFFTDPVTVAKDGFVDYVAGLGGTVVPCLLDNDTVGGYQGTFSAADCSKGFMLPGYATQAIINDDVAVRVGDVAIGEDCTLWINPNATLTVGTGATFNIGVDSQIRFKHASATLCLNGCTVNVARASGYFVPVLVNNGDSNAGTLVFENIVNLNSYRDNGVAKSTNRNEAMTFGTADSGVNVVYRNGARTLMTGCVQFYKN